MQLKDIVKELNLKVLSGAEHLDQPVTSAYASDILSDVMAKARKDCLWITNQTHENVIAIVFFKSLAGVIMAGNMCPDEDALKKAQEKMIPVLISEKSAYEVCGMLYQLGIPGSA